MVLEVHSPRIGGCIDLTSCEVSGGGYTGRVTWQAIKQRETEISMAFITILFSRTTLVGHPKTSHWVTSWIA